MTLDEQIIHMPSNYIFLRFEVQKTIPCIWAMVDVKSEMIYRKFRTYPTGVEVGYDNYVGILPYVGSYQMADGNLVFHVFEEPME